jgi:phage N-6-adenine-methyltransferase
VNTAVMFSSATPEWETPQALFDRLSVRYGGFTLDVCASHANAKCQRYFTPGDDGLLQPWKGHRCWMNPPYGREIGKWVEKAATEARAGAHVVVALLPARTDTAWFHKHIYRQPHTYVEFLRGRVRFGNATAGAPFPSMVVAFNGAE